jgi:hypothetical protein
MTARKDGINSEMKEIKSWITNQSRYRVNSSGLTG